MTAKSKPAAAPWQPTYYDHLLYRWIKFEGRSQGWVASNFHVSQPTISRMMARYERWQSRTKPHENGQLDHAERLRAQRWLTYERNELILHSCLRIADALEGFTDTTKTVERMGEHAYHRKETTTTSEAIDRTGTMAYAIHSLRYGGGLASVAGFVAPAGSDAVRDRKSTRLNSSHRT